MSVPEHRPAALDLSGLVRPGDSLVWSQGAAEPLGLTAALAEQAGAIGPLEAFVGLVYNPALADLRGVRLRSYGMLGAQGEVDREVVPCHLSAVPGLLRAGRIRCDVVLCQLAPADAKGIHSFGVSVDYMPAAVEVARVVIGEINEQMPVTAGAAGIHESRLDAVVRVDRPLIEVPQREPNDIERAIGERVAALVGDGATVQLGIGTMAAAVAGALGGHRDLGVHSGLVTDWLVDLVEAGVVTNASKRQDRGISVCSMAVGTTRLRPPEVADRHRL